MTRSAEHVAGSWHYGGTAFSGLSALVIEDVGPAVGGELAGRLDRPLTRRVAGGQQLMPGPVGDRLGAHRGEQAVGGPQLGRGIPAPVVAAPFAGQEAGAGHGRAHAGAGEPVGGLAIVVLAGHTLAQPLMGGWSAGPAVRVGLCIT